MRRPGARWWSANGKTVGWKSDTVAEDYVTRKSRCARWFRRPRQPSRGRSDGCRRHRKAATPGEKAINNSGQTGGQRNEKKSCGNGGAVESVEIQNQDFPSFHRSLEISQRQRDFHIPTAPTTRPWKSGKPKSRFPTFPPPFLLRLRKKNTADCVGSEQGHF